MRGCPLSKKISNFHSLYLAYMAQELRLTSTAAMGRKSKFGTNSRGHLWARSSRPLIEIQPKKNKQLSLFIFEFPLNQQLRTIFHPDKGVSRKLINSPAHIPDLFVIGGFFKANFTNRFVGQPYWKFH